MMEISTTRAAAYVGAGAAVGGGFAALRASSDAVLTSTALANTSASSYRSAASAGKLIGMGVLTGVVAGSVQALVEAQTGSGELGWASAVGGGAVAGAVLLKGLAPASFAPIAQRGIGAAIGATVGMLAPVAAGILLAQVAPDS